VFGKKSLINLSTIALKTMRLIFFFILFVSFSSCKQSESKTPPTATPSSTVSDTTVVANVSDITCATTGALIEKFEQNNAKFELYSIMINDERQKWLKVLLPNSVCKVIHDDTMGWGNHHSLEFKDWDGDGFKDRIDSWKWDYEVNLFSKERNDFSRKINSRFNGDQWDFDKSKGLKFQFLENKYGGIYQLYSLKDTIMTVYSELRITNTDTTEDGNPIVYVRTKKDAPNTDVKIEDANFFIEA
jgi:hypothetical protein